MKIFILLLWLPSTWAQTPVKTPTSVATAKPMAANSYEEEVSEEEAEKLLDDSSVDFAEEDTQIPPAGDHKEVIAQPTVTPEHGPRPSKSFPGAPKPRDSELIQGSAPLYK